MYYNVDIFTVFHLNQITSMTEEKKMRLKTRKPYDGTNEQLLGSFTQNQFTCTKS